MERTSMTRYTFGRWLVAAALLLAFTFSVWPVRSGAVIARQAATPAAGYSCETATPAAATPEMGGMAMGTPTPGMATDIEFDQLYIDMMLPHHGSILALAESALPRLQDERLREIAQAIIDTQSPEIEELKGYREAFYGSAEPMAMDDHMMGMMAEAMPALGSAETMAVEMDPDTQVALFCTAADADLAFIDLTIPHHESAIGASEAALTQATREEVRIFAERVIEAQQREIQALTAIRAELVGAGTPVAG